MTLKEFLYCATSTVEIIEGPDDNYAKVMILPSDGVGDFSDCYLAPDLLSREVSLFDAKDKDVITVYLELEKKQPKVEGVNNG